MKTKEKPKAFIKEEYKGRQLSGSYVQYTKYDPKKYAKKQINMSYIRKNDKSDSNILIDTDDDKEITEEDILTEK